MGDRRQAAPHRAHDEELVARAVADDLAAGEALAARGLLASCDDCAALAADLRAIVGTMRELAPAASRAAAVPAPRDFRLSEADAARLRRRGYLGLGGVAGGAGRQARGLGGALAALGLVGLLAASGMPSIFFGAGGAATSDSAGGAATTERDAAMSKNGASTTAEPAPAASDLRALLASGAPAGSTEAVRPDDASTVTSSAALAVGSVAVLLIGLALLLSSRSGRRAGP